MTTDLRRAALLGCLAIAAAFSIVSAPAAAQLFGEEDDEAIRVIGRFDPNVRKATAIVNGDVVTDMDVEQRLTLVLAARGNVALSDEERQRLRLQILRNLIDEKLQISEAAENDVVIPEQEVNEAFARVARNFQQTPEQFEEFLRQNGASARTLKDQIRAELSWSRLLRRRVEPFVSIGDDEVQAVIDRLEAAKGEQEYRLGEIFLAATPENQDEARQTAASIVEQVRKGASFIAYARQFSQASTAAVGGDMGWVTTAQIAPELQPVVENMSIGDVSEPVAVTGGITIVYLADKREVLGADPRDAVLTMKQIAKPITGAKTQEEAQQIAIDFQQETAQIAGCGQADAVAARIGADLLNVDDIRVRELPEGLQNIVLNMQVGEVSPPFGTNQDVRVLVLCGRDDAQTAAAPSYDQVYAQLNDQRMGMMARRYLRDLRRDAIIDYR